MPNPTPPKLVPPFWFAVGIAVMVLLHLTVPVARVVPRPWTWIGLAVLPAVFAPVVTWSAVPHGSVRNENQPCPGHAAIAVSTTVSNCRRVAPPMAWTDNP